MSDAPQFDPEPRPFGEPAVTEPTPQEKAAATRERHAEEKKKEERAEARRARRKANETRELTADNEQDRVEPIADHGPQQPGSHSDWAEPGRVPDEKED